MPYIIVFAWYPPDKADEVARRYLELLQKYPVPDYVKRLVPAATTSNDEGIEVLNVDEVKRDKLGDALDYANKFMIGFRDIEEYRWEIDIYSTISEGLKYIGMG